MKLSQAAYDGLQWVVRVFIPLFITFYVGLDQIVPAVPATKEVAGVLGLLAVFLGGLLTKSSLDFKKNNEPHGGYIQQTGLDPDTGMPEIALTLTQLPQDLVDKKTVTLKVDKSQAVMLPAEPPADPPVSDPM